MPLSTEAPPRAAGDGQQKDNLCGPFHAARLLRAIGVTEWQGESLDQDLVARYAGTTLPGHELAPPVPPGAASWREYRFELERVDAAGAGTSAPGLAAAIEELSGGRLECVPLSGEWSPLAAEGLVIGAGDLGAQLIANLRTGCLWASRPPLGALLAALDGLEVPNPPRADWDVGHYVELSQLVRGRRGALVLVRDSYPSLGWGGTHLQPPAALAAALRRGDGRGGGVLAVTGADRAAEVEQLGRRLGLEAKIWDN